jgi:acetyl esterase/lipase
MHSFVTIKNSITFKYTLLIVYALFAIGCVQAKQPLQPTKNIQYNRDHQLLDLYLPASRDKDTAIVFIHGGTFDAGNKEDMADHAKRFADLGFVTASINYRLSLRFHHPAAINDATDAINWIKNNASTYGYNPNKIVLVGYSAGGTIALNVGLEEVNKVAAIIDVSGIADIGALIQSGTIPGLKTDMDKYMQGEDPALASPLFQVNEKSPPVFIFHGDQDDTVPISQSIALTEKLKQYNVPVSLRVFPNAGHEIMLPVNSRYEQILSEINTIIMGIENSSH